MILAHSGSSELFNRELGVTEDDVMLGFLPVGLNWGWYQNKEIDALADKVQATFDEAERTKILQRMHEMVVEEGAHFALRGENYISSSSLAQTPIP